MVTWLFRQAREAIPTEPAIWITASKLEEAQGHAHKVDLIIEKAISSMRQFQASIWMYVILAFFSISYREIWMNYTPGCVHNIFYNATYLENTVEKIIR